MTNRFVWMLYVVVSIKCIYSLTRIVKCIESNGPMVVKQATYTGNKLN